MKRPSLLALLFLSFVLVHANAQDAVSKVTLEQKLRNVQKQLAKTWRVDANATAAYTEKRFGEKALPLDEIRMLKQFADVHLAMSEDGVMRILDRSDPTKELHRAPFFLVINLEGTVYFIGDSPSATGLTVVGTVTFADGNLVWSAKHNGPDCAVFVAQKAAPRSRRND